METLYDLKASLEKKYEGLGTSDPFTRSKICQLICDICTCLLKYPHYDAHTVGWNHFYESKYRLLIWSLEQERDKLDVSDEKQGAINLELEIANETYEKAEKLLKDEVDACEHINFILNEAGLADK